MANNLDLSPDGQIAFSLASLRELEYGGPVESSQHLVPGIFFSLDPESTNAVTVESHPGELMTFRLAVDRPGRWLTLNMSVGSVDFTGCKIIGFACKLDSSTTTTFRVCLRSGRDGGHNDVFFKKSVVSYPKTALHLDVLELDDTPEISARAPWREIVIFFQREPSEINLRDFRLIVI
jgi:hypothetical protein